MGRRAAEPLSESAGKPAVWLRRLRTPWLAVVLGVLCYLNSLGNGFTYDDKPIIEEHPRTQQHLAAREIWLRDWWYPPEGRSDIAPRRDWLYRPLTVFTFVLNHAVGGLRPFGFHLLNVVLHATVCGLVWWFARRLTGDAAVAALAAVLFAVHPVHVEAVANIVGRAEVLTALFLLAGLLVLLPPGQAPSVRRGFAAAPFFLLALLAKETAVCYVALAVLVLHHHTRAARLRLDWWARQVGVLVLPLVVYFPLRFIALEYRLLREHPPTHWFNPLVDAQWPERVLAAFTILGHYTRLLIAPAKLSSDYGVAIVDPQAGFNAMTAVGLGTTVALLIGLVGYLRKDGLWRLIAVLVALTLASYALISNTVLLIGVTVAERLVYWLSVPVLILFAAGAVAFWRHQCAPGRPLAHRARLLATLGTLLIATFGLRTVLRNSDWVDNATLFERDVANWPQGLHLNVGHAETLLDRAETLTRPGSEERIQLLRLALQHCNRALEVDPANTGGLLARARTWALLGDLEAAARDAETALVLNPENRDARKLVDLIGGTDAETTARRAALEARLAVEPEDWVALRAYGLLMLDLGRPELGREPLERVVAAHPTDLSARRALGQIYQGLGRTAEARGAYERVLEQEPNDWMTHANLGYLLVSVAPERALQHARRAYELMPSDPRTGLNYAETLAAVGRRNDAIRILEQTRRNIQPDSPLRTAVDGRIRVLRNQR